MKNLLPSKIKERLIHEQSDNPFFGYQKNCNMGKEKNKQLNSKNNRVQIQ